MKGRKKERKKRLYEIKKERKETKERMNERKKERKRRLSNQFI